MSSSNPKVNPPAPSEHLPAGLPPVGTRVRYAVNFRDGSEIYEATVVRHPALYPTLFHVRRGDGHESVVALAHWFEVVEPETDDLPTFEPGSTWPRYTWEYDLTPDADQEAYFLRDADEGEGN